MKIETHPLTSYRWSDFASLMMSRFDTRHCWCTAQRLPNYRLRSGAANRRSIKRVVDTASAPPGVLAYVEGKVAGWCAIAPRDEFPRVSRLHGGEGDDRDSIWSVTCFYVLRDMRMKGLSRKLLRAAVALAREHGANVVEGYPVLVGRNQYRGRVSVFRDAGFEEITGRVLNRPLMRYAVTSRRRAEG